MPDEQLPVNILWKKVLDELQLEVSSAVFNTMFKQTILLSVNDNQVNIACTSPMIQQLIETRYHSLMKQVLDKHIQENTVISFTIDSGILKPQKQRKQSSIGPLFQQNDTLSLLLQRYHLRPEYTLDSFAVSTTNQMAYAAGDHVAKNLGRSYNPLLLYGGVGVGKTHLMQGIAHAVLQKNESTPIVYCAGEDFTNEIVQAIRTKTTPAFRNKYRKAKLLCIDDIQFIAGKDMVQEEFFHTFNSVIREGGQIILTSDRPPTEIQKLEDRLRSRLEGGLIIDIAPPDFELRAAILLNKAKGKEIDLPMHLAQLIATTITDTRGLEGALMRIESEMKLKNAEMGEALVLRVLGQKPQEVRRFGRPSKDEFIEAVCRYYGVKQTLIKGKKRDQSIVLPRQILMYMLRTELNVSLTEIGDIIGGRDHTTVMHAVEKISTLIVSHDKTREDILGIKKLLSG